MMSSEGARIRRTGELKRIKVSVSCKLEGDKVWLSWESEWESGRVGVRVRSEVEGVAG